MKRVLNLLIILGLLAALSFGSAEHRSDQDIYVTVSTPLTDNIAERARLGKLGKPLFDLQEGTHQQLKETTGVEVDHFYLNLCLGDACLPVDPFTFGR